MKPKGHCVEARDQIITQGRLGGKQECELTIVEPPRRACDAKHGTFHARDSIQTPFYSQKQHQLLCGRGTAAGQAWLYVHGPAPASYQKIEYCTTLSQGPLHCLHFRDHDSIRMIFNGKVMLEVRQRRASDLQDFPMHSTTRAWVKVMFIEMLRMLKRQTQPSKHLIRHPGSRRRCLSPLHKNNLVTMLLGRYCWLCTDGNCGLRTSPISITPDPDIEVLFEFNRGDYIFLCVASDIKRRGHSIIID